MNEEEAKELMTLLSHNPLSIADAKARWEAVDEIVIDVEATGGGTVTLKDIETGRTFARYIIEHEMKSLMRCAIYNEDGSVTHLSSPNELKCRDSGFQRSFKQVDCCPTVKATRAFSAITLEYDGPAKFWNVSFVNPQTDTAYPVNLSFLTDTDADKFIQRYIGEGCPPFDSKEFLTLKNECV